MLSFAIRSEEEDAEKIDADSHSDSSSVRLNWLNLTFVQPDNRTLTAEQKLKWPQYLQEVVCVQLHTSLQHRLYPIFPVFRT